VLGVGLLVDECPLEPFQSGAPVVEDVRVGAKHDIIAAHPSFECEVDQGAERLDVKTEIVNLATHVVHTKVLRRPEREQTAEPARLQANGAGMSLLGMHAYIGGDSVFGVVRSCASYPRRQVIWRSVLLVPYVVLAAVVAVSYGVQGLVTLMYFYFVAGAWLVFVLAWGSLAQKAGRLNAERVWRTGRWSPDRPHTSTD
jgi:hypothetical protein